jgi:heat shock protein HslJ
MTDIPWRIASLAPALVFAACGRGHDGDRSATTIAFEDAANTTYEGIYEEPIALEHGRWEGEPFAPDGATRASVVLLERLWVSGDLDGDGAPEAVVLLSESSGGSGSYLYIAVVGHEGDEVANLGTALVGDRVQVRMMRLTAAGVELDVIQHGPQDAACCPTQKATRTWVIENAALAELPPRLTGELSVSDLEAEEWVLTHLAIGEPVSPELRVSLAVTDGQVSGSAGCNRYFGPVTESAPGVLKFGPIGSTRMACPDGDMNLEARFLEALQNVHGFGFLEGQLALSYQVADQFHILLFVSD